MLCDKEKWRKKLTVCVARAEERWKEEEGERKNKGSRKAGREGGRMEKRKDGQGQTNRCSERWKEGGRKGGSDGERCVRNQKRSNFEFSMTSNGRWWTESGEKT